MVRLPERKSLVKVVKIGGALITIKNQDISDIDDLIRHESRYVKFDVLRRAAEETSEALRYYSEKGVNVDFWFSHGAGPYGHSAVGVYQVTPKVREYTDYLNKIVTQEFAAHDVPAQPLDAAKTVLLRGNQFEISGLIKEGRKIVSGGSIPFSYGTVVGDRTFRIFSADDFLERVSVELKADDLLAFTDAYVSTSDPKKDPNAKQLTEVRNIEELQIDVDSKDRTQGLLGKVVKIHNARKACNTRCRIVNGMVEGDILSVDEECAMEEDSSASALKSA